MMQCAPIPEGIVVSVTGLPPAPSPRVSAHNGRLLLESDAWARVNLQPLIQSDIEDFLARQSPLWMSYCFPDAPTEVVRPFYNLYQIMFLLDDLCSVQDGQTIRKTLTRLAATLSGRQKPVTRLEFLTLDTFLATMRDDPPGLMARTRAGMVSMLNAFVEQAALWQQATAANRLSLAQAMPVRERSVGIPWYMTHPEHIYSCDMTTAREQWPLMKELADALARQTWYVNEVCSFRKEHFHGDHQNLVCVILASGATTQEAFNLVSGWAAQMQRDYASLATIARNDPRSTRAPFADYLDALDALLTGSNTWQYSTVRYHGPGFRCSPTAGSTWALHRDRTELVRT
ncbi:terpene synthase family protein [Actinomycetes bacterium KLBMP 9759]